MAHERETIRHLRVGRHRFDPGRHGLTHRRPAAARHTHAGELDIGDVEAVARKCAGERLEVVAIVASAPEATMDQDHRRPDGGRGDPDVVDLADLLPKSHCAVRGPGGSREGGVLVAHAAQRICDIRG